VIRGKTITEDILQGEMNEPSDSPGGEGKAMTRVVQKIMQREDGLVSEIQPVLRSPSVGRVSAAQSPFYWKGLSGGT
jgi:hypothetical protein